jgi:hypothetical protein
VNFAREKISAEKIALSVMEWRRFERQEIAAPEVYFKWNWEGPRADVVSYDEKKVVVWEVKTTIGDLRREMRAREKIKMHTDIIMGIGAVPDQYIFVIPEQGMNIEKAEKWVQENFEKYGLYVYSAGKLKRKGKFKRVIRPGKLNGRLQEEIRKRVVRRLSSAIIKKGWENYELKEKRNSENKI